VGVFGVVISTSSEVQPLVAASAQNWVFAGGAAVIIILIFLFPVFDALKNRVGSTAQPLVDEHNESRESHADIRAAIALINQAVVGLQKQIDQSELNRRESIRSVQDQLNTAIELLRG
jgi:hypothetical protein